YTCIIKRGACTGGAGAEDGGPRGASRSARRCRSAGCRPRRPACRDDAVGGGRSGRLPAAGAVLLPEQSRAPARDAASPGTAKPGTVVGSLGRAAAPILGPRCGGGLPGRGLAQ